MKKLIAMILCLFLMMTSAHASVTPIRDMQGMDIDIGVDLQQQMNAAVGEMLEREVQVFVYTASFDGEKAVVLGDVYESDGPDALGAYLHHCQLTLQYEPEMESGFSVLSCDSLSPEYRCGDVMQWEPFDNDVYGYSFNLPTGFQVTDETARHMRWQIEEGETLSVEAYENPGYQKAMEDYLQNPTGEVLMENEAFGYFYTYGDDFFEMYIASDGMEYAYKVQMAFPKERQGEYLLYGEIIRNSFLIWGGAVG